MNRDELIKNLDEAMVALDAANEAFKQAMEQHDKVTEAIRLAIYAQSAVIKAVIKANREARS